MLRTGTKCENENSILGNVKEIKYIFLFNYVLEQGLFFAKKTLEQGLFFEKNFSKTELFFFIPERKNF